MAWLLDLSREEKEQFVIRLYKENKSIREIAKLMHMSFRDIGQIINKLKEEKRRQEGDLDERDNVNDTSKSKITQAIKLFSEGKNLVQVLIALDLPADEVRAIYREFWELKGMHKLVRIYEVEYDVYTLLRLHKMVKDLGMGEQEIINTLKLANNNEITYLQERMNYLRSRVSWLEIERKSKEYNLSMLNNRTRELTYRGDETYAMNNSTKELTYRADKMYPTLMDDKTIRPLSSNMRLVRRNDTYKSIDSLANEFFDASADWVENHNNRL